MDRHPDTAADPAHPQKYQAIGPNIVLASFLVLWPIAARRIIFAAQDCPVCQHQLYEIAHRCPAPRWVQRDRDCNRRS